MIYGLRQHHLLHLQSGSMDCLDTTLQQVALINKCMYVCISEFTHGFNQSVNQSINNQPTNQSFSWVVRSTMTFLTKSLVRQIHCSGYLLVCLFSLNQVPAYNGKQAHQHSKSPTLVLPAFFFSVPAASCPWVAALEGPGCWPAGICSSSSSKPSALCMPCLSSTWVRGLLLLCGGGRVQGGGGGKR